MTVTNDGKSGVTTTTENDGGAGGDGGSGGDGGTTTTVKKETAADVVARADHERALADMHKYKKEVEKYRNERETEKTTRMKEQNQWKELAEAKEKEANDARTEAARIQNSYLGEKKFNAVRAACDKLGIRPEAVADLEMFDLGDVQIETTSTGKINVLGADKFAERMKAIRPHWFADKTPPNVNTNGTRTVDTNGEITIAMLMEAEAKGKKSGDMSEYKAMHLKYRGQSRH